MTGIELIRILLADGTYGDILDCELTVNGRVVETVDYDEDTETWKIHVGTKRPYVWGDEEDEEDM